MGVIGQFYCPDCDKKFGGSNGVRERDNVDFVPGGSYPQRFICPTCKKQNVELIKVGAWID